jgi:hypothetical protein
MSDTLTVERQWQSAYSQISVLRDDKGKVVQIITSPLKQPQKPRNKAKTTEISIKGKTYKLKFL